MGLNLARFERMAQVTDRGLRFVGRLEFQIILDEKVLGDIAVQQPGRHPGLGRSITLEGLHCEAVDRLAQEFDHLLGTIGAGRLDHEPASHRIDPCGRHDTPSQRPGAQFLGDAQLEVAHLPAAQRESLLGRDLHCAILGELPDDRRRQQLLLGSQRDQLMLPDRVHQSSGRGSDHPAAARHFQRPAGLERAALEPLLQVRRGQGPALGQSVHDEVFEQHGSRGARYGGRSI